jgi:methionyl-tRNA formyltransferase
MSDPVVVLAGRSETSYLQINHLAARFDVAHVIFEAPHLRKMLRYRLRKLGAWKVAGQLAFLLWDRLVIRPRSRGARARRLAELDIRAADGRIPPADVESVNGSEVAALLREIEPAVVVVSGTGIIGKRVLALGPTFINVHCGITPRYRGVHGAFWAVYEGRPELAGVTVHLVDPGVDTGAILGQALITVDPRRDTYRTLPVKQYLAALDLLAEAVQDALAGTLKPYTRDDLESRQWYSPTPGEYLHFVRQMRKLRSRSTARSPQSPGLG